MGAGTRGAGGRLPVEPARAARGTPVDAVCVSAAGRPGAAAQQPTRTRGVAGRHARRVYRRPWQWTRADSRPQAGRTGGDVSRRDRRRAEPVFLARRGMAGIPAGPADQEGRRRRRRTGRVVENLGLTQDQNFGPPGLTWGRNGTIVYANNLGAGLSTVRETGGKPETFTELDPANNEASHRLPHFLPDASAVLFTVLRFSAVAPDWTRSQIWVKSTRTGERKHLLDNAQDARVAGNALIFAREGKLF